MASEKDIAITERFFFAMAELKKRKVIRGLKTFTTRHGYNQGNIITLKNNTSSWRIPAEWLANIAQDYGVSSEWLLLGNGDMFVPGSPALVGK